MPVVKSLSTNTSHATLLSSIASESDTEPESAIQLELSQRLPSRDVSTLPYSTEFNAAFKSSAQPFEHMVEPTSHTSKIENLDDKGPGTIRTSSRPPTAAGVPASTDQAYRSGHRSTSPSVTNNVTLSGPPPAGTTSRHGEEAVSADSHLSAGPKTRTVPNKHELQVVPDEHSIVDDALLKCTPYIVNTKYMVLICTDCKYCIIPDRARGHLRKDHPHCKVDTTFFEQLNKRYPGLVAETIHPPEITEAVFGLAIPVEKYTVCSRCRRGYLNISTWEHHLCRNADANLVGQHAHFRSLVQTFFRGPSICYFPIDLPVLVSNGTSGCDDFDLFKADFQEIPVSDDEIHESEDYRELNQFLLKEGWIDHVSGLRSSELSLLTCLPKDDEILKPIAKEVFALADSIQRAIGSAGYHVRRLLGRRPAYVFPIAMLYHC